MYSRELVSWGNVDGSVIGDAFDAVIAVQILVQSDLEDRRATLAETSI